MINRIKSSAARAPSIPFPLIKVVRRRVNLANLVTWQSPKEALLVHRAKLEVFPASKVNHAKTVPKESIVKVKRVMVWVDLQIKLQILRNVSIVQLDGHQMKVAPSANPVRLELSATSKVMRVEVAA